MRTPIRWHPSHHLPPHPPQHHRAHSFFHLLFHRPNQLPPLASLSPSPPHIPSTNPSFSPAVYSSSPPHPSQPTPSTHQLPQQHPPTYNPQPATTPSLSSLLPPLQTYSRKFPKSKSSTPPIKLIAPYSITYSRKHPRHRVISMSSPPTPTPLPPTSQVSHPSIPLPPTSSNPLPSPSPSLPSSSSHVLTTSSIPEPLPSEPSTFCQATDSQLWRQAMDVEYNALLRQKTRSLVHSSPTMNIIGCKWIYLLKHHPDGSVERYKARLVAKGYTQTRRS